MTRSINQMLAEFGRPPVTVAELGRRRDDLVRRFHEQHGLATWEEIAAAIWTQRIDESEITDEWIQLRAGLEVMGMLPSSDDAADPSVPPATT